MAEKFLIDRVKAGTSTVGGSGFCIPYSLTTTNDVTVPKGAISFFTPGSATQNVTLVEYIYVDNFTSNNNNISPYLTGSSAGNVLIHKKDVLYRRHYFHQENLNIFQYLNFL